MNVKMSSGCLDKSGNTQQENFQSIGYI